MQHVVWLTIGLWIDCTSTVIMFYHLPLTDTLSTLLKTTAVIYRKLQSGWVSNSIWVRRQGSQHKELGTINVMKMLQEHWEQQAPVQ